MHSSGFLNLSQGTTSAAAVEGLIRDHQLDNSAWFELLALFVLA